MSPEKARLFEEGRATMVLISDINRVGKLGIINGQFSSSLQTVSCPAYKRYPTIPVTCSGNAACTMAANGSYVAGVLCYTIKS